MQYYNNGMQVINIQYVHSTNADCFMHIKKDQVLSNSLDVYNAAFTKKSGYSIISIQFQFDSNKNRH